MKPLNCSDACMHRFNLLNASPNTSSTRKCLRKSQLGYILPLRPHLLDLWSYFGRRTRCRFAWMSDCCPCLKIWARAKVKFESNRHRVLIARSASTPNDSAAVIFFCLDNDQLDDDSQAIDAVRGCIPAGRHPNDVVVFCSYSWKLNLWSIVQLHRLRQWQSSHWRCHLLPLHFWGQGRVDGLHFSLYIPRGKEGCSFRRSNAHTGISAIRKTPI